jgi:hypothetical protein
MHNIAAEKGSDILGNDYAIMNRTHYLIIPLELLSFITSMGYGLICCSTALAVPLFPLFLCGSLCPKSVLPGNVVQPNRRSS